MPEVVRRTRRRDVLVARSRNAQLEVGLAFGRRRVVDERQLQRLRRGRKKVDQVQEQALAGGVVRIAHEVRPHERHGAASHGVLRDRARDLSLRGVRHAHQAPVVGQVHAVLQLGDRAELGVQARFRGEALEQLRTVGNECAALLGRADGEHAAVLKAEALRHRVAPVVGGVQRNHMHALRRRAEHRFDQALGVIRPGTLVDDHDVRQIALRRRLGVEFRDVESPLLIQGEQPDSPQPHLPRLVLRLHRGVDRHRRAARFAHHLEEALERLHARDLVRGEIRLHVRREVLRRCKQRCGAHPRSDHESNGRLAVMGPCLRFTFHTISSFWLSRMMPHFVSGVDD